MDIETSSGIIRTTKRQQTRDPWCLSMDSTRRFSLHANLQPPILAALSQLAAVQLSKVPAAADRPNVTLTLLNGRSHDPSNHGIYI
ncbi:hypothetical protein PAAG_05773 [Paracoccidioides lutzii Pb01]|uniref:Uncharacterized protein n=1 Tax=Paracoccidioides lutzii (strain ATCC MYA-826 / Pb01) TaxID=502779 RepID=C1H4T3_PARBA|nr:hypothetical protein PAAG_05773 [Paracoccidioides lutzii Pb01]EEH34727.2 hypothetical protein PAAG_05773 [Paracoccidioides lutzii Pb01]